MTGRQLSTPIFPDATAWATAYCSPSGKTCRARGREALTRVPILKYLCLCYNSCYQGAGGQAEQCGRGF